jgi:DNA-binding TFAR19-related protein (PDSD5 family)
MADTELEMLRKRRLLRMQKRFSAKKAEGKTIGREEEARVLLDQVFVDRAWEVFEVAKLQYPEEMKRIGAFLVKLVSDCKIRRKISGGELLSLLRQLGLRIHLETQIRFMEHGKSETLAERIKETE